MDSCSFKDRKPGQLDALKQVSTFCLTVGVWKMFRKNLILRELNRSMAGSREKNVNAGSILLAGDIPHRGYYENLKALLTAERNMSHQAMK